MTGVQLTPSVVEIETIEFAVQPGWNEQSAQATYARPSELSAEVGSGPARSASWARYSAGAIPTSSFQVTPPSSEYTTETFPSS